MKDCNQCGKCCINYSDGGLTATEQEIEHWRKTRPDIYAYVQAAKIWIDPRSGLQLVRCPWLVEKSSAFQKKKKYSCAIYQDRPADCRHYPVTIEQMKADECEMLEPHDLKRPKAAQRRLDVMMLESRNWSDEFLED